jgi:chemotaxis protein methyltransferase CheR
MTNGTSSDGMQMSARDFNRLATFINRYSGIRMPQSKRVMVEGRLRRRLRNHGFTDFTAYCRYLFDEGGLDDEAIHIIDAVTTNKTEFFREGEQFRFLFDKALPDLLSGRNASTLKLWSAACSIGAEPYTMAMVMEDFIRRNNDVRYSILATDLCVDVLQQAVRGIYPEDLIQPVPVDMRRRYLLRGRDEHTSHVRIAPEIRRAVTFARLNLMDELYPVDRGFDVIFCRNVLIYFSRADQEAVLSRLTTHLAPGGYLFLGHSEAINNMALPLRAVGPTIFMKTSGAADGAENKNLDRR